PGRPQTRPVRAVRGVVRPGLPGEGHRAERDEPGDGWIRRPTARAHGSVEELRRPRVRLLYESRESQGAPDGGERKRVPAVPVAGARAAGDHHGPCGKGLNG